jgi:hypothetical protein
MTTSLNNIIPYEGLYGEMYQVLFNSYFWLITFLTTSTVSLPMLLYLTAREFFYPTISHVLRRASGRESKWGISSRNGENLLQGSSSREDS